MLRRDRTTSDQVLTRNRRWILKVMFMSGYSEGDLLVLNYGWAFIQKPLVAARLVHMIKNVLHSSDRSQPGGYEFDSRKDAGGTQAGEE